MAFIPKNVRKQSLIRSLHSFLISQGKVGDQYRSPDSDELLISVRSDRLSANDFVLPLMVKHKGQVLTALADFWAREILEPLGIENHLVGSEFHSQRNMAKDLKGSFPDIDLTRTLVVRKIKIMKYELIFRFHPGGSVWTQYQENEGVVAGVQLPLGLRKWQKLEKPLFTPSTKAAQGHDENITQEEFFAETGKTGLDLVKRLSELYEAVYDFAQKRGILLLDTKLESDGKILGDEWFNPDTSRYVSISNFSESFEKGIEPEFLDKQPVRDFCATIKTPFFDGAGRPIVGLGGLDPKNMEHCEFVAEYAFPIEIAEKTTERYLKIFKALTGMELFEYQERYLL